MKKHLFIILIFFSPTIIFSQKSLPDGYGNLNWGTKISSARDSVKGKIVHTDEKKVIISREGELYYTYGFFYKGPKFFRKKQKGEKEDLIDEGKLFYVTLKFPLISLQEILTKYEDKYGDPSSKNLRRNRGAISWDSDKTIIILWIDNYKGKAYCGRIVYLSKEIVKEINTYTNMSKKKLIENLVK